MMEFAGKLKRQHFQNISDTIWQNMLVLKQLNRMHATKYLNHVSSVVYWTLWE